MDKAELMGQELDSIDLTPAQRKTVLALLRRHLPDTEVWACGSRVKFTAKPSSDLDMVVFSKPEQELQVSALREAFEESDLPFRVDLFVWDEVSDSFKKNAEAERVVLSRAACTTNIRGWKEMSFCDAFEINPKISLKKGESYPFVEMKSIESTQRNVSAPEKKPFKGGGSRFKPLDTLMARITPCLENGKIARYVAHNTGASDESAFGSTEFIVIRGKDGVTESAFAYYLVKWQEFQGFAVSQMTGTSGRQRVSVDSLRSFSISVPPLPEQRAIAQILGSFDDKIELNQRMNETLEDMAQALFKSWFVDFEPVKAKMAALKAGGTAKQAELAAMSAISGKDKAALKKLQTEQPKAYAELAQTTALFPSAMEKSDIGEIPVGWRQSTVGEEFHVTMGQSPPGHTYNEACDGMPFFQGRADYGFRYPANRIYCTEPTRLASKGDTLVSVRAPVGDINMAAEKCCIGRGVAAVRHKSNSRSYTYYSMRHLRRRLNAYDAEGTVFGSISQKDFKALPQLAVPRPIIQCFHGQADPLDQKIEACNEQNKGLSSLRDALLPRLLSGRIRVSVAPLDAPETSGKLGAKPSPRAGRKPQNTGMRP